MILFSLIYILFALIGIGLSVPVCLECGIPVSEAVFAHFSTCVFCAVMCGVASIISRLICRSFFSPDSALIKVTQKEVSFLEKCGVKKWKDKIPDMGFICGFRKNLKGNEEKNPAYFGRFLYEDVVASMLHTGTILLSPLCLLFLQPELMATIGTTTLLIAFVLNIMPVMVQRYNRPRLLRVYKSALKKERTLHHFAHKIPEKDYQVVQN